MEKNTITITNEQGEKLKCEVLFTFESDETKKNYIVYTDNTTDENKNIQVYASIFNPEDENSPLEEIKTQAEYDVIQNIFSKLQEENTSDK